MANMIYVELISFFLLLFFLFDYVSKDADYLYVQMFVIHILLHFSICEVCMSYVQVDISFFVKVFLL